MHQTVNLFFMLLTLDISSSANNEMQTFLVQNDVSYKDKRPVSSVLGNLSRSQQFSIGQILKRTKKNKTSELTTEMAIEEVTMINEMPDLITLGYDNSTEEMTDFSVNGTTFGVTDTTVEYSSTPISTTTEIVRHQHKKHTTPRRTSSSSVCLCDLTRSACDINCCCDKECLDSHRSVFGECIDENSSSAWLQQYNTMLQSCHTKDTFYFKNNTEWYKTYQQHTLMSHLFCVVKENLPPRLMNNQPKIVETMDELNSFAGRYHMWPTTNSGDASPGNKEGPSWFDGSKQYSYGDRIWVIHNATLQPLELPRNLFNTRCQSKVAVKYMVEIKNRCSVLYKEDNNYVQSLYQRMDDMYVVSSPHKLNETWIANVQDCPQNVCIPVAAYICDEYSCMFINETEEVTLPQKITSLKVYLYANGSSGYTEAKMYFGISTINSDDYVEQDFEVRQSFIGENNATLVQKLSGNPGYLNGKPIILTRVVRGNDTDADLFDFFSTSNVFPLRNILPYPQNKQGFCTLSNNTYNQINFRENVKFSCAYVHDISDLIKEENATKICLRLQNDFNRLFSTKLDDKQYVAKLGNPSSNPADWVSLLDKKANMAVKGAFLEASPNRIVCSNLVLELDYVFVYALVEQPNSIREMHVTGAGKTLNAGETVFEISNNNTVTSRMQMTVRFVDSAMPISPKYARGPHFNIHLPQDFFYPFGFSGSSPLNTHKKFLVQSLIFISFIKLYVV